LYAKQKTSLSVINELLEQLGNRRVKNLAKAINGLEPLFDLAAPNLLLDINQEQFRLSEFTGIGTALSPLRRA